MNTKKFFSALILSSMMFFVGQSRSEIMLGLGSAYNDSYDKADPITGQYTDSMLDSDQNIRDDAHYEGSVVIGALVGALVAWLNHHKYAPIRTTATSGRNVAFITRNRYVNNFILGLILNELGVLLLHHDGLGRRNPSQETSMGLALVAQCASWLFVRNGYYGGYSD